MALYRYVNGDPRHANRRATERVELQVPAHLWTDVVTFPRSGSATPRNGSSVPEPIAPESATAVGTASHERRPLRHQRPDDSSRTPPARAPRVDIDTAVDLDSDTNFYAGLTQDISSGGLFLATEQLRRVGERVRVQFVLPRVAAPIAVEAEVRWTREGAVGGGDQPAGMGLKFLGLSREAELAIAGFVKQRETLLYDED
jgi:uncharacterized protein (TIGR02266 family)